MLMETVGAFYKIVIWIQTMIVIPSVHLVYYGIYLTKMNKQVNKEKKLGSKWKPINLGYCFGGTCYVLGQTKHQKTYKQI